MSSNEKKPFRRLPKTVVPVHYNLTLEPDLEKFTFKGNEIVELDIKKATSKIIMNCVDIELSHVQFSGAEESFKASGIKYDADSECVILEFPFNLPLGKAKLHMEYVGELNDKMKGFYRSSYKTPSGEDRHCAVTQFEATDARRAFPCWDEPAIKATFDITLVVPSDRVALSNMNVISDTPIDESSGRREVRFATTPIMSTYLVAFVVGEFDYVEDFTSSGLCVRTYTPVGKANQGKFALEVAVKTLPFYSDYFGIAYPLPKIDLIAIPDFSAGAMENWGLVTYRETALLVDPEMTSAAAKQWVALVVGHELAHQWFGNLVTMEWWTHLWLNEGFASWIEYLCVDHCFPDYDIWTQFVTADYVRALELDALKNSHPIEVPVGHPTEIDEIFDTISYSKGASVIRMLHSYMGDKDFRDGLHSYLTNFKFGNASTDDLWSALEQASKEPVGKIMNTWTKQMGFPVLSISDEQNGTTRILKIRQSKFSANGDCGEEDDESQWLVPITIVTSKDPSQVCLKTLLSDREMVIFLEDTPTNAWVKLNAGQVCFYRANYSEQMLGSICKALEDMSLPPRDRLGLENDLFALAQAGEAKAVDYLKMVTAFVNEDNYTVWSDIAGNLSKLGLLFQYLNAYEDFSKFVVELFKPVIERVGWEPIDGEGHLTALLRSLAIAKLGCHGHEETVKECQRRFTAHSKGESSISADLRAAIYATVMSFGDEQTLTDMLTLYRSTDHKEEQMRMLRCIGMTKDPDLVQKVLEFSMSEEVRFQDTVFALASCGRSIVGRDKLWLFVKENWSEFQSRYHGGFLLARLVKMSTEYFATEEKYNDVKGFFESNEAPAAERTVQQSLESIRLNINWIAREGEALRSWIRDNC